MCVKEIQLQRPQLIVQQKMVLNDQEVITVLLDHHQQQPDLEELIQIHSEQLAYLIAETEQQILIQM